MNWFPSFSLAMAHLLRVLFIKLAWHVIWLLNGMEVNNKWPHCRIIMQKMDEVECLVSRVSALLFSWVIHLNFFQCILCPHYPTHFHSCKNASACSNQTNTLHRHFLVKQLIRYTFSHKCGNCNVRLCQEILKRVTL